MRRKKREGREEKEGKRKGRTGREEKKAKGTK